MDKEFGVPSTFASASFFFSNPRSIRREIPKYWMGRSTPTCNYCSRTFKRAEHLTRHLRTHTREKPYSCRCGATFTRRDLLTRHWRLSQHAGRVTTISDAEQLDRPRVLEGLEQQQALAHSQDVVSPSMNVIANIDTQHSLIHNQVHESFPEASLELHHHPGDTRLVNHQSGLPTDPHEGFDDFRDFVNFIDGVGLSAQWTPEYDFDWLGINDVHHHESRRPSHGHIERHSPAAEDIGTPFSTWLPTAPADDQIHLRPDSDDSRDDRHRHGGSFRVTEEHRKHLVSLLQDFSGIDPNFEMPSRHTLSRYVTAFFGGFHSHFPYIHAPTYKPTSSPIELTLAMCATGAQYCFERRSSERLFSMAKAIVFERLNQEASNFSPQTLSAISPKDPSSAITPHASNATRSSPWTPLDMAKTILTLVGFATWGKKTHLTHAFCLRDLLVHVLRDIGLVEEDTSQAPPTTSPSARWDRWIQAESTRRTKLVAFCYINVHSIAYNVYPSLWTSELHLQLPCQTSEWQAPSAAQWLTLQREGKEAQMLFQTALSILLSGTAITGSQQEREVHPIPSPIGNYILLHAILQRIYIVRELAYTTAPAASIASQDLQIVARALRSWTSLWQQAPESILDPNNESGPIPFTSSSLLVVAYVRLSLNIGPYRHLASRDTTTIADGLTKMPAIENNENILSALLYSTHALSIPVRLGIDRVARSQAFFWSVQHAISSFECAVFLGKWLCSLPAASTPVNAIQDAGLNRSAGLTVSEQRILQWVRCIIREAYMVIDFDEVDEEQGDSEPVEADQICRQSWEQAPFALGLAVLKIWSRFFRGNTQWQFVVNLGLSLEKYSKALEDSQT